MKGCFWIMSRQFFRSFIWRRCSQHSQENICTRVTFLINIVAGLQFNPIFIRKEVPALVLSWQLCEMFNNSFFKEHCYKKSIVTRNVDQISIANLITQLFIQLRQDFCISTRLILTTVIYSLISRKKSLKVVNKPTIGLWQSLTYQNSRAS